MSLSDAQKTEILDAYSRNGENATAAARDMDMPRTTYHARLQAARAFPPASTVAGEARPILPEFPDDDVTTEEIIDMMSTRFGKRAEHAKAQEWFSIQMPTNDPISLDFVGDPHVDDNGCHWPLLRRDVALMSEPGHHAVNIGDSINNWVGRLAALYADQDTSKQTARRLTKWLMLDSGVNWLIWLMGNHDAWSADFVEWMRAHGGKKMVMQDWQARFKLVFPNGRTVRVHAAHNFKGNSIWNSLHGAQKAAHTGAEANIYACGHLHNWALHHEESAARDFTYWLVRARGYKYLDHYADNLGFYPQQHGATIGAVIDPEAKSEASLVSCFADLECAARYLRWLRSGGSDA